jgi:hypothetical protein
LKEFDVSFAAREGQISGRRRTHLVITHGDGRLAEGQPDRPALHVAPDQTLELDTLASGQDKGRLAKEDRHEHKQANEGGLGPSEKGGVGLAERREERERPDCERQERGLLSARLALERTCFLLASLCWRRAQVEQRRNTSKGAGRRQALLQPGCRALAQLPCPLLECAGAGVRASCQALTRAYKACPCEIRAAD